MGNNLQKIILYLTINTENLKFYVGLHECDPNVYDYYLGDGCYANDPSTYNRRKLPLAFAIRSNGVSKFKRIILGVYDNMKDAEKAEKAIVTEDFVKRTDNYNTIAKSKSKSVKKSTNPNTIKQWSKTGELINEFASVEEASEKLDIPKRTIVNSLFRRGSKSGYYFTNPNEDFSDIKNKSKIDFSTFYCYDDKGYVCKEYHDLQEAISIQTVIQESLEHLKDNSAENAETNLSNLLTSIEQKIDTLQYEQRTLDIYYKELQKLIMGSIALMEQIILKMILRIFNSYFLR